MNDPSASATHQGAMSDESFELAKLLVRRVRVILWTSLAVGLSFTALEVLAIPPRIAGPFYVKCVGNSVIVLALLAVRDRWALRYARLVAIFVVVAGYVLTAVSGMSSPSREYSTTGLLFVAAAVTTAALLPWGVWPQVATVLIGGSLLCEAVLRADGNLDVLLSDPGAAVAIILALSIVAAREMHRYRLGAAADLAARHRAENELRALNVALEQRVAERTDAFRAANDSLRALSARLESVREDERTRIAREIHDDLGQVLTALKMEIVLLSKQNAAADGASDTLREGLGDLSQLADSMLQSVRRISSELRPSLLDDLGLVAAIRSQAREHEARSGVKCTLVSDPTTITLDRGIATALFRIVQEALTNVARHAAADRVRIDLRLLADEVRLEIADDGCGISEAALRNADSLGLLGMRERAHLLGGEATITGRAGKGTVVRVRLPVAAVAQSAFPAARG